MHTQNKIRKKSTVEKITIKNAQYRGKKITNQTFELIKPIQEGKRGHFVTVKPNKSVGIGKDKIRININPSDVKASKDTKPQESDQDVMNRIESRFAILNEMTKASINADVKAMIVSGPPGVGKSYGVEKELAKANMFDAIAQTAPKYEVVKGAMTPIGLYRTLFRHSAKDHVLVFDDCDAVLQDDLSLNLLKAALDSGKRRRVHWNADSNYLRREGIPEVFDFCGAVIFITNIKFDNIRSKKLKDHLEALQSRCHYLDLTLDTMRDKFLRVKQIAESGELFKNHDIDIKTQSKILNFMEEHKDRLNEMSLRMALKIADLVLVNPKNWKFLALNTCMKYDR